MIMYILTLYQRVYSNPLLFMEVMFQDHQRMSEIEDSTESYV